jgi:hypothetical protein
VTTQASRLGAAHADEPPSDEQSLKRGKIWGAIALSVTGLPASAMSAYCAAMLSSALKWF